MVDECSLQPETIKERPETIKERPETIVVPVSVMGDVSNIRRQILQNTLDDELKEHFRLIPQDRFEEVQEKVFEELKYDEVFSTHLVGVDRGNGQVLCINVETNAAGEAKNHPYITTYLTTWLATRCYRKITIRHDGEPMLVAIMQRLRDNRTEETHLQQSPQRSSQSLGAGERAIRTVKDNFRTWRVIATLCFT